jgi:hypothetical protein
MARLNDAVTRIASRQAYLEAEETIKAKARDMVDHSLN